MIAFAPGYRYASCLSITVYASMHVYNIVRMYDSSARDAFTVVHPCLEEYV